MCSQSGTRTCTDAEKAALLNEFFIDQCAQSKAASADRPPPILIPPSPRILEELKIAEKDVARRLSALDSRKADGNDFVPTKLLKIVAEEISPSLSYLFRLSLVTG